MADNLEKYFKKHLSDETPSEEKWNVPSDNVWEKALPLIREKKGFFISLKNIYIISVLLLLGLTTTLGIIFFPDANNGDDQITGSRTTAETEPTEFIEPVTGSQVHDIQNVPDAEMDQEDVLDAQEADDASPLQRNNEPYMNRERSTGQIEAEEQVVEKNISGDITQTTPIKIPLSGTNYRIVLRKSVPLNSAPVVTGERETSSLLFQRESLQPEYSASAKPSFIPRKNKFGIGLYYAPTFNNTSVKGEISAGELVTGNHYLYSGNYGLTVKYYFSNRLSIISGFGSLKVKSWSETTTDFSYDGSNEHIMPGGEKENMSGIPLATPFGEIGTEITYRFPESENIPDGEPMEAILETHQDISYFSVPLGIEYDLLPINKHLQWYAEGGIRFNWASGDATEFDSRILHYGNDMNVVDEIMTNHPDYTDYYLDFYIGSGLSYSLTKYLLLQGSLRYTRNITRVNVQDDLYTRVQAAGLKISILYIF